MINDGLHLSDEREVMHSFLMVGQSNMAGRGKLDSVPWIENNSCFMLRMGRWQAMREPINPDRSSFQGTFRSGISLGASFADDISNRYDWKVGLIPCADGGTQIKEWMPGEILFDHAVMMTKLAMRTSKFCGIIWHQGESDCIEEADLLAHKEMFLTMARAMRAELGAENLPFIIGEVSNLITVGKIGTKADYMNARYREAAEELGCSAVVSAEGLELLGDHLHFDAPSLRVFGSRYAKAYFDLIEK